MLVPRIASAGPMTNEGIMSLRVDCFISLVIVRGRRFSVMWYRLVVSEFICSFILELFLI